MSQSLRNPWCCEDREYRQEHKVKQPALRQQDDCITRKKTLGTAVQNKGEDLIILYWPNLHLRFCCFNPLPQGAQWLNGRVLNSRQRGRRFEPHRCHCVVSLSKNINPSLVLVLPRKTRPFITERLLMGRKESNQTKSLRARIIQGL